jgi:hypothetical protein
MIGLNVVTHKPTLLPSAFGQTDHTMDSLPVSNKTVGEPESVTNKTLETGAAAVQVNLSIIS